MALSDPTLGVSARFLIPRVPPSHLSLARRQIRGAAPPPPCIASCLQNSSSSSESTPPNLSCGSNTDAIRIFVEVCLASSSCAGETGGYTWLGDYIQLVNDPECKQCDGDDCTEDNSEDDKEVNAEQLATEVGEEEEEEEPAEATSFVTSTTTTTGDSSAATDTRTRRTPGTAKVTGVNGIPTAEPPIHTLTEDNQSDASSMRSTRLWLAGLAALTASLVLETS